MFYCNLSCFLAKTIFSYSHIYKMHDFLQSFIRLEAKRKFKIHFSLIFIHKKIRIIFLKNYIFFDYTIF